MGYYNTNQKEGNALLEAVQKTKNQEGAVLAFFLFKRGAFTPSEIYKEMQALGKQWPITSCRRTLTDLTKQGHLIKTAATRTGMYNEPEHLWVLNNKKHPFQVPAIQSSLFKDDKAA